MDLRLLDPEQVVCDPQVRGASRGTDDLSVQSIAELAASFMHTGQVQPCIVTPMEDGRFKLRVGERRLRAVDFLKRNNVSPGNHQLLVVVRESMTPMETRMAQLAENTSRVGLDDSQLAQALIFLRCGLAEQQLATAGVDIGDDRMALTDENPVALWSRIDKHRTGTGIPQVTWSDVISECGLGITESKARRVASAFRRLPPELSADLDIAGVSTSARERIARFSPVFEAAGFDAAKAEIIEAAQKPSSSAIWDVIGADTDDIPSPYDAPPSASPSGAEPWAGWDKPAQDAVPDWDMAPVDPNDIHLANLPHVDSATSSGEEPCPPELIERFMQAGQAVIAAGGHIAEYDQRRIQNMFDAVLHLATVD